MADKRFVKTVRYLAHLPWPVSGESTADSCVMGLGWRRLRTEGFATPDPVEPNLVQLTHQPDGELATITVPLIDRFEGDPSDEWVAFQEDARAAYRALGEEIFGAVQQEETLDGGTADSWLLKSGASVSIIVTPDGMVLKVASPREGRAELARQVATP